MAYIQDISVLMRELLKVPKDYTPTAVEISRYIKSRYSNDQIENTARRPMGSRGFSSASRSAPPRVVQDVTRQPVQQSQQPLRLVNRHQKMSGRSLTYSTLPPNDKAKQQFTRNPIRVYTSRRAMHTDVTTYEIVPESVEKKSFTTTAPRKIPTKRNVQMQDIWDQKPKSAPPPTSPIELPASANRQSFWNWKSAKNHIRRAMSDLVVSSARPKNKLALLSEIKLDPKIEEALEAKRKGMLRDIVDTDVTEREPLRTREIIQRLLEENKLEDQRREIARLTELARSKVIEARRSNYVPMKNRKRRDERL